MLGTWIVLRGLAFFSHAVGAAAFPGLVLAEGLGFAAPVGALGAAVLFAAGVGRLARRRGARYDNLTALTLTGALALGVLLASDVFHSGTSVDTLLFGSLFLIEPRDVLLAAAASALTLAASFPLGPIWLAAGFDEEGLRAVGVRAATENAILLALVALVVVASLSAIGALLAAALLVVPAATARLWINRVFPWQVATVLLTAVEGVVGVWLSVKLNAPPGSTIATLSGAVFAVAALARSRMRVIRRRLVPAAVASVAIAAAVTACGSAAGGTNGKLPVVATTTQIGDWARALGGDVSDVHQILRPNTDPHEYEPRPADVQAVASAELVFLNGDGLDHWAGKVVSEAGGNPRVIDLSKTLPDRRPGEKSGPQSGTYDPHWWHDPQNAIVAVQEIGASLEQARPSARAAIARRTEAYVAKLRKLDGQIRTCFARLPKGSLKLITNHDAFGYFAHRYGLQIVGAVIPSQTTLAQPSARDVSNLVDLVRREHVASIFAETSVNPKLAHTIARETGARSDLTLYGDALGASRSGAETYLTMEAANARTIALGVSGGRVSCKVAP